MYWCERRRFCRNVVLTLSLQFDVLKATPCSPTIDCSRQSWTEFCRELLSKLFFLNQDQIFPNAVIYFRLDFCHFLTHGQM